MERIVHITARLVRAVRQAYARKWTFLGLFAFAFLVSVYALAALDLLPDAPAATQVTLAESPLVATTPSTASTISQTELPVKITIPTIDLVATIANPTTTDVETLDHNLLSGAVRYPTSATLGEEGNVVLFGHSSYLPVVNNQAYKTFDGIQKLKSGDTITVYSSHTAYVYGVKSVSKESANDAAIPLSVSGRELTLSTCNSFGAKSDRFVVVADFVESHAISG